RLLNTSKHLARRRLIETDSTIVMPPKRLENAHRAEACHFRSENRVPEAVLHEADRRQVVDLVRLGLVQDTFDRGRINQIAGNQANVGLFSLQRVDQNVALAAKHSVYDIAESK